MDRKGATLIFIIFITLLCLGALSSLSETSLFSLNAIQSARLQKKFPPSQKLFRRPRDLLVSVMLLNIGVNLLVQNVASEIFGSQGSWALTVGLPLLLTLLFSELLPKVLAMSFNESIASLIAPFALFLLKIFRNIVPFIATSSSIVARYLFFFVRAPEPLSSDELAAFLRSDSSLKRSAATPELGVTKFEGSLLGGLLSFQEAKVEDLMRPRSEIIYYDWNQPIEELLLRFGQRQCSQIPVCDGDLDRIEGVLYALDLLGCREKLSKESVQKILKPAFFLPESSSAVGALQSIEKEQEDLLLAVNEYGVITGLLTTEDLLEAVVGDIKDARDQSDPITSIGRGRFIAMAHIELEPLFEKLKVERPKTSMSTLGGLLCELYGDIPHSGCLISYQKISFRVLEASDKQVLKVYINDLRDESEIEKGGALA